MSTANVRGIAGAWDVRGEVTSEIFAYVRQLAFNEYPLVTRLNRSRVGADSFDMVSRNNRAKALALGAAISNTSDTVITLGTGQNVTLMLGDVLEFASGERAEITAINPANDQVTVRRGQEGTTAATQGNGSAVRLLYNSRTGAEVNQGGFRTARSIITQRVHTFQVPVEVGGRANALANLQLAERPTLISQQELEASEELLRDAETAVLYGIGNGVTSGTDRWRMTGLRRIAEIVGNRIISPTNGSSYRPHDFVRDTVEALALKGGMGNTMAVSPDYIGAFALWGHAAMRIDAGSNIYGVPIDVFEAPFISGVRMFVNRSLRPRTAVLFDDRKVSMRFIRDLFIKPRGSAGDAMQSDVIADWAVEVEDAERSVQWLEGVTTFAAP